MYDEFQQGFPRSVFCSGTREENSSVRLQLRFPYFLSFLTRNLSGASL